MVSMRPKNETVSNKKKKRKDFVLQSEGNTASFRHKETEK